MKLIATADTFLKALPTQTTYLKQKDLPNQLVFLKAGTELEIIEHFPYEGRADSEADDHLFVQLAQPLADQPGIRWFVYSLHAKVEGVEPGNDPQDEPAPAPTPKDKTDSGPKILLPGISRPVGIYEPIYYEPTPSNFTWSEMTAGGTRIPTGTAITQRIVKLCKYMDEVRTYLGGKPIVVNSGYRDPITNRRVKGASNSRHLRGDAVDFYVKGVDVVDTFYKVKKHHPKGGLAVGRGFVHIDLRPGPAARWSYRGGPKVNLW
ncbi:MAG: D-Ala-D-Ala carboxypeptidase family metallohydrolase [Phormidesmis sp.]